MLFFIINTYIHFITRDSIQNIEATHWQAAKKTNMRLWFLCRHCDQMQNTPVIFGYVQQEALLAKQTAIHGGHMWEAPSVSTTSRSFTKTATSACGFYSRQHMSLLWWQSWLRLSCCSCPLVQTYIFRYLSAFIIPSSVAADKGS